MGSGICIDEGAQARQMRRSRVERHDEAVMSDYAGEFRGHNWAEYAEHGVSGRIVQRQISGARDCVPTIGVSTGRNSHRRFGDVDTEHHWSSQSPSVAPLTTAHIQDNAWPIAVYHFGEGVRHRVKHPGSEKAVSGSDHLGTVAWLMAAPLPGYQQVDVSFACHVETVAGRTHPAAFFFIETQTRSAHRT